MPWRFNAEIGSFVQTYGSRAVDASLLMIPCVGFLPPEDPRVRGTVAAIERDLVVDGLVRRYKPHEDVEGLRGSADKIIIMWRAEDQSDQATGAPDAERESSAAAVDLTRTTNHDYAQFLGPQRLAVLPQARLRPDWKRKPPRRIWDAARSTRWS